MSIVSVTASEPATRTPPGPVVMLIWSVTKRTPIVA
jgi:hypothetical protein